MYILGFRSRKLLKTFNINNFYFDYSSLYLFVTSFITPESSGLPQVSTYEFKILT